MAVLLSVTSTACENAVGLCDVILMDVHADANPVTSPSFVFVTVCVMSTLCLHKKSLMMSQRWAVLLLCSVSDRTWSPEWDVMTLQGLVTKGSC